MGTYQVPLIHRAEIAKGTMAFSFEKPPGFAFTAGQSLDVILVDPPGTDAEGHTRTFSIASAPHEDQIMVATRMRDTAFKVCSKRCRSGPQSASRAPTARSRCTTTRRDRRSSSPVALALRRSGVCWWTPPSITGRIVSSSFMPTALLKRRRSWKNSTTWSARTPVIPWSPPARPGLPPPSRGREKRGILIRPCWRNFWTM